MSCNLPALTLFPWLSSPRLPKRRSRPHAPKEQHKRILKQRFDIMTSSPPELSFPSDCRSITLPITYL